MGRFIIKHINTMTPQLKSKPRAEENKIEENKSVMTTDEKVAMAQNILNNDKAAPVKKIRKDKGLIERTESSKTILTEDNKELLND